MLRHRAYRNINIKRSDYHTPTASPPLSLARLASCHQRFRQRVVRRESPLSIGGIMYCYARRPAYSAGALGGGSGHATLRHGQRTRERGSAGGARIPGGSMDTSRRDDGGSQGMLCSCYRRSVGQVAPIAPIFRPPTPLLSCRCLRVDALSHQRDRCCYRRVHRSYAMRASFRHMREIHNYQSSSIFAQLLGPEFILNR